MAVPGLKVVAPAFPADVKGLLAAAVRDPDPVLFFEQKSLYSMKGEVPTRIRRRTRQGEGVAPRARLHHRRARFHGASFAEAANYLEKEHGISCTVVDVRSLVPLDTQTILSEVAKTEDWSRSKKIRAVRLGAESRPLSPTNVSGTSTARSCASPRRIFRCRRLICSRIIRFRRWSASCARSGKKSIKKESVTDTTVGKNA